MKRRKALVVAVHSDDETLMCAGALLKHKYQGDSIYWLIVTSATEDFGWDRALVTKRNKEIIEVADLYNFDDVFRLGHPTTQLDTIPIGNLISSISDVINKIKPDVVYLPNIYDVHTDHNIVFRAAFSCTKNFRYPFIKKILIGETMSETDFAPALSNNVFVPNLFIDITDFMEKKLEIMSVYESEIMPENYPRSLGAIKSLASFRGCRIGVKYAEAFQILLEVL